MTTDIKTMMDKASFLNDELYISRFIILCFENNVALCDVSNHRKLLDYDATDKLRREFIEKERGDK